MSTITKFAYLGKRGSLWGLGLCFLFSLSFFIPLPVPSGIDSPTPIGAYLNGIFPSSTPGTGSGGWSVELAYPNLTFVDPVAMIELPDQSGFYIATKPGRIWKIASNPATSTKQLVLDFSQRVDTDGDAGLINAILHPEFGQAGSPNRGYIYVVYRYHPQGELSSCDADAFTRLSRFNLPDGASQFDANSEFVLIQQFDTHCWHTGGGLFFGTDGFLYVTFGDAGGANDEFNTTQQIDRMLLGGLLRIDVDRNPGTSHPIRRQPVDPADKPGNLPASFTQGYYIPNDNPWLDVNGGILEEFYAIGLRSPHRASFDPVTGKIWVGDVGQGSREEISDIVKGGNYQWPYREGSIAGSKPKPNPLIGVDKIPTFDYSHAVGNSIIGGFVYRGAKFAASLGGKYLFGDHGVRNIWTLDPNNGEVIFLANVPGSGTGDKNGISSFATNTNGEVYILKLFGTNADGGRIYRLKQDVSVGDPPQWLSQTGAFTDLSTLSPAPGLVPYDVNAPLWSDGAAKKRWIALPNNGSHNTPEEQIVFSATSEWQFPAGTVFIKHFDLPVNENDPSVTKRVETRFIIRTEDGGIYGVTYKWNDAQTDAELLTAGATKDFAISRSDGSQGVQTWNFPSRTDCITCHNTNANFMLGVKTWQLNGDFDYPSGIVDNQLTTWRHLGMFANPFTDTQLSALLRSVPLEDNLQSLEIRVRSYLDANCSNCHRPNGVSGAFDARFSMPLESQNLINALSISSNSPAGSYIVVPNDPQNSQLWVRDNSAGTSNAMPPLAKNLIDAPYIQVLTDWINSLPDCQVTNLTDLNWTGTPINGWGPVETDTSNGEDQAGDGGTMSINGQTFTRGLGVHAYSEVIYDIGGQYQTFRSFIGVDDECVSGSVVFLVYTDGLLAFQSPILTQADDALQIAVDVEGVNQLKLVVQDAGDGPTCDHANWAGPQLDNCGGTACPPAGTACNDGNPDTVGDIEDGNCNCAGTPACDQMYELAAVKDAYVQKDARNTNFGSANVLEIQGGGKSQKISFIQFSLNGVDQTVVNADLIIRTGNFSGSHMLQLYEVSSDNWSENTVNWGNQPGTGNFIGGLSVSAQQSYVVDLTAYAAAQAAGDKVLSLAITGNSSTTWSLVSREGSSQYGPALTLTTRGNCGNCAAAGTPCDDQNPATYDDQEDGNCNCAGTPCPSAGTACNDNNPNTVNDVEDGNCNCAGTLCEPAGTPCDDLDDCTVNDVFDDNCNCNGTYVDNDDDGFCVGEDPDDNDYCVPNAGNPGCSPCTDIAADNFENGWGIWNSGGNHSFLDTRSTPGGNYSVRLRGNSGAASSMYTNNLNLAAFAELRVQMSFAMSSMKTSGDGFALEISTNGGSSYNLVKSWNYSGGYTNDVWYGEQVTIPGIPFTVNTRLRFICRASNNGKSVYIDDVVLTACNGTQALVSGAQDHLLRSAQEMAQSPSAIPLETREKTPPADLPGTAADRTLSVQVRPNPFRESLVLYINRPAPALQEAVVRVLDQSGRIIYQRFNVPFDEDVLIPQHAGWTSGLYFIRIQASDYGKTLKVIKQ